MGKILASLLAVITLSACSWQEWVARNVTLVNVPSSNPVMGGWCGGVRHGPNDSIIVAVDEECFRTHYTQTDFWLAHEKVGHAAAYRLGYRLEDEAIANCIAEAVTGIQPTYTPTGYPNCVDSQVQAIKQQLRERLGIET